MSNDDRDTRPLILYVSDLRCRPRANMLLLGALRAAVSRREIRLWRVGVDALGGASADIERLRPDGVVAPRHLHPRLRELLGDRCALFDLAEMVDGPSDHSRIFVDIPGAGRGVFDEAGRIELGGFHGADTFPWDNVNRLRQGLDGIGRSAPPVSPGLARHADGGLTAFALEVAAALVACALWEAGKFAYEKYTEYTTAAGEAGALEAFQRAAIDAGLKRKEEEDRAEEEASKVTTEPLEEDEEPEPKDKKQEPDDILGPDMLRTLIEFFAKVQLDAFWQALLRGQVPPERTDDRDAFFGWLHRRGLGDQIALERLITGMPTSEDDETRFAFLYWCWMTFGQAVHPDSRYMKHLVATGAPIDPIGPGRAGHIVCANGEWNGNAAHRQLSVHFWSPIHGHL